MYELVLIFMLIGYDNNDLQTEKFGPYISQESCYHALADVKTNKRIRNPTMTSSASPAFIIEGKCVRIPYTK